MSLQLTAHQEVNEQILDEYLMTIDPLFADYVKSGELTDYEKAFKNVTNEIDLLTLNIKKLNSMGDDDLYLLQESENHEKKTQHIKDCKAYEVEHQRYEDKRLVLTCLRYNLPPVNTVFGRIIKNCQQLNEHQSQYNIKPDSKINLEFMTPSVYKKTKIESLTAELKSLCESHGKNQVAIEECRAEYINIKKQLDNFDVYLLTVDVGCHQYQQIFYDDQTTTLNTKMWEDTKEAIFGAVIKEHCMFDQQQFRKRLDGMALEQRMFHNKYPDQGYEIKIEYIL